MADKHPMDPRSSLFSARVDEGGCPLPMSRDGLAVRTQQWPVTHATPDGVAGLLRRSREQFVDGVYTYGNFTDAAAKSLQAVEVALKERLRRRKTFEKLIDLAHDADLISNDDCSRLHAGRKLRNLLIHADAPTTWPPALVAEIIDASHRAVASLYPDT